MAGEVLFLWNGCSFEVYEFVATEWLDWFNLRGSWRLTCH